MDTAKIARAYRRRAEARETARLGRHDALWQRAREIAAALHGSYGSRVIVYAFGSLLDRDRFRSDSDIDLAVEGLDPAEYWDAWAIVEALAADVSVDFVRLESATGPMRETVMAEGRPLP